nr:helix-turn-helix domain-containing protein [Rhodoplanes tepidamans]
MSCQGSRESRQRWQSFISRLFGPADISIADERRFFGDIRSASLGRLAITRVRSSDELGSRRKSHLIGDTEERLLFVMLRSGTLSISQGNRECELEPGTCTLFDASAPYDYRHRVPTEVVNICFPAGLLSTRLRDPRRYIARRLDEQRGLNRILSDFVESLSRETDAIPAPLADRLAVQITDMIGSILESSHRELHIEGSAVQSAVYRRCIAFIESNLADPDLDPESIAAASGISVRYLHSVFRGSGQTVGDYVRKRRLTRSYEDLTSDLCRRIAVKEIAYRNGFRNPAHFANAFKLEFAVSPSEVRAAATPATEQG